MPDYRISYHAGPTLTAFHKSDVRRRGVMGPVGSGKSTGMCAEIMRRAQEQEPGPDGKRKTRWVIVRNSYRELKDTTLKTWLDWFPELYFGDFKHTDMQHSIRRGDVEADVLFRALDRPDDVGKLLSLELTGGWVNEARELPLGIIEALDDRIGRYPAVKDGGCTWRGLMMDTNPPDDDHWWYRLAEEERPEGWAFWRQPGGLVEESGEFVPNPLAENLKNLEPDFYAQRAQGKSRDHIRVYYCARYGFLRDGRPVWPEYADDVHCAQQVIQPDPSRTLYIGLDFGLTPAALFAQQTLSGRWVWIDELVTENMGVSRFAEILGPKIRREYQGFDIEVWGDPAGNERAQTDEQTPFLILRKHGINAQPAPTNDFDIRRDAVGVPMTRMFDGLPGFMVSPKCRMARKGLAGGYHYRRIQIAGEERYHDKPVKDRYSHVCEAGQYAMLGAGEGNVVIGFDFHEDDDEDHDAAFEHERSELTGY